MIIYDINWEAQTAGPSPDNNRRTELFLYGCKRACAGNPCKGCFNTALWDNSSAIVNHAPSDVADNIIKHSPNKYITIGGGEPTDQIQDLIILCKMLYNEGYHIMIYTWKDLYKIIMDNTHLEHDNFCELIRYCHIVVDGEYDMNQRLYIEDKQDGFFNSIGSGNQTVWSIQKHKIIGIRMGDLRKIDLDNNYELHYYPQNNAEIMHIGKERLYENRSLRD